jgi:twinkle protein
MIEYSEFLTFDIFIPASKKANTHGDVYVKCPKCTHLRTGPRKTDEPLSCNIHTGMFWCNHCNWKGNVKQRIKEKEFKPLVSLPDYIDVSAQISKWIFDTRKISPGTLQKLKITTGRCHIRQIKHPELKEQGKLVNKICIAFNYIVNNELINTKYRDKYKNFAMISGADKPMYNIDSIKESNEFIIVEGELDVCAWTEIGYLSVVSVPNGTTLSEKEKNYFEKTGKFNNDNQLNLEYIDKHWSDFIGKEIIYLGTDTDAAGLKLMEELSRRLGKRRCKKIRYDWYVKENGEVCKDANDVLFHHGKEALLDCKNKAEDYTIDGIITVKDIQDELEYYYDHGLEKGKSTGFKCLNDHFTWVLGHPVWINGYSTKGKSTFAFNLLPIASMLYGWKFAMYCPENYPIRNIAMTMADILVGNTSDKDRADRMSKREYLTAMDFINTYFTFIDDKIEGKAKRYAPNEILDITGSLIAKKGIVGLYQDPWKSLKHNYAGRGLDEYLEDALSEEVTFATANGILNIIAVHPPTPTRNNKDDDIPAPDPHRIKGGSQWLSSAYEQLCIHKKNDDIRNTYTEIHVQKVKEHKLVGIPTPDNDPILMQLKRRTGRFEEEIEGKWTSPLDGFIQNILNIKNKNLEFGGF